MLSVQNCVSDSKCCLNQKNSNEKKYEGHYGSEKNFTEGSLGGEIWDSHLSMHKAYCFMFVDFLVGVRKTCSFLSALQKLLLDLLLVALGT